MTSNVRAARKLLRTLRAEERDSEMVDALGVLLVASAELTDACLAPGSKVPVYARVKAIQATGGILAQIAGQVQPVPEDDAFGRFIAGLTKPTPGAADSSRRWD